MQGFTFGDEFIKIMDYIGQRIGVVIDWTAQNVTPYIQDLLRRVVMFEIYTSIFYILICLGVVGLGVWLIKLDKKNEISIFYGVTTFFGLCVIVGFSIWALAEAYDIIVALTIPEKIYYDYFIQIKNSLK